MSALRQKTRGVKGEDAMSEIRLTIDGKSVVGREGQTILEVAEENGVKIPNLCHHERLPTIGACRICCVDVGRPDKLEAACAMPISNGMVVQTKNERVLNARRLIVELLLSNRVMDVRACEKNGRNVLLEIAEELNIDVDKLLFVDPKKSTRVQTVDTSNPLVIRDPNKCVLCGRCVSACNDLRHYGVLSFERRGFNIKVVSGQSQPLLASGCVTCGECVSVCPTGAIMTMPYETFQGEIDNVISTGRAFQSSQATSSQRGRLNLPSLDEIDVADLKEISKKTGLASRSTE